MSKPSTNALYQALVDRLEILTGQDVGDLSGASNHRLLSYLLLLFNSFEGGAGGGGASLARANVVLTTPSIAAGAQHSTDLNLGGSFLVQSVTTSHPARVRLYRTTAARTADASRAASAEPTDAIAPYLLLEVIAPLGSDFTIPVNVAAAAAATNGVIYALFDNRDTVSRAITATFSNLTLEGVS